MAKTVSSAGLQDFIETGKPTVVFDAKGKPVEAKADEKSPPAASKDAAILVESDDLTADERTLPEKAQKEIQRVKKAVNEKHRLMKKAQEEAEADQRLAETQYNERVLAEKARDAALARVKELEAKVAPPAPELVEPNENDPKYKDAAGNFNWKQFSKDQATFVADQAVKAERDRQRLEIEVKAQEVVATRIRASAVEARKVHKDFDEVMSTVKDDPARDIVPQFVIRYIEDSDNSAFVAYHLATNPEVAQRIGSLSPIRGIKELGDLERELVKPPSQVAIVSATEGATAVKSGAASLPAPITPLAGEGTSGVTTDPSKMNFRQLREFERERNKRK